MSVVNCALMLKNEAFVPSESSMASITSFYNIKCYAINFEIKDLIGCIVHSCQPLVTDLTYILPPSYSCSTRGITYSCIVSFS